MYYYRARHYDPQVGRFIQMDPIGLAGGDTNLYRYVKNSPLRFSDPLGLEPGDIFATADEAARDAISYTNPISIAENVEYGGWIYGNDRTGYTYTMVRGTVDELRLPRPPYNVVADYHTHGADVPGYLSEIFSPDDIFGNQLMGIPGYLGTPQDRFLQYNPFVGVSEPNKCKR